MRVLAALLRRARRTDLRAALIADWVLAMVVVKFGAGQGLKRPGGSQGYCRRAAVWLKLLALGPVSRILFRAFRRFGRHFSRALSGPSRSEEHTSELQSLRHLVCR